jgi:anti-sigma B factor antagonist
MALEEAEGVSIVRFTSHAIVDAHAIQLVSDELFRLVDELGHRKLLLDFGTVRSISSTLLTALLKLHHKLKSIRGQLALCGVGPDLLQVFKITKLDDVFSMYPDEAKALASF